MNLRGLACVALLLGFLTGAFSCATNTVASIYARDFDCSEDQVSVSALGKQRFRVLGCGRSVTYECVRRCVTTDDDYGAASEYVPAERRVASHSERDADSEQPRVEKGKQGVSTVALELRLDAHTLLKLRVVPAQQPPTVQLVIARIADDDQLGECANAALINGDRMNLPSAHFVQSAHTRDLRVQLPGAFLREFASAHKFALKSCDFRWNLPDADVALVRRFAELYQQEMMWAAPARAGGTGGRIAPADGWPAWQAAAALSAVKTGPALEGPALFKLISPSVFEVIVNSGLGTAQGSAVAISANQLLTNCHVLEGAQKIKLQQGKNERTARIAAADPVADRCVLTVTDGTLVPIRGMRTRADLEIGEALYTVGSPNGLESSISSGVLSGIREERGYTYVQTTAAISPGSSGGGLFDARGNLVGITTLVLVGSEHLNQSLNFAIPAEFFAQP